MKKCSCCKNFKTEEEFPKSKNRKDGLHNECKLCNREKNRIYREKNKEKEVIRRRLKYLKNKKSVIKKDIEYKKRRSEQDPSFKLLRNLRDRHSKAVKNAGKDKNFRTKNLLGCDSIFLKQYFESKFTYEMSWDNHGKVWHIDHIFPLSKINWDDIEDVKKYCHFSNLQPLLIKENLKKSNKII